MKLNILSGLLLGIPLVAAAADDVSNVVFKPIEETVVVYNWSDYMPEELLENFTKETGIKVEYSTFGSNEVMYSKLKILRGRGYDVIFPSTYLVNLMKEEGLIQPLNHKLLKNINNLSVELSNLSYDPGNKYSIPYLWGTTGVAIDQKQHPDESIQSWSDLWDIKWRQSLVLQDDMREVFHMALKINGHSTNTTDPDEIKLAYERLLRLLPNIKEFSDAPADNFLEENAAIGLAFNGDIKVAQDTKPELNYVYPIEGTTIWIDSFVIPSRAKNVENAHKFIDYMLKPEVAALCATEIGYATPNVGGKELLPEVLKSNPVMFPPKDVMDRVEYQKNVGDATATYKLYWEKLKSYKQ